ncbi:hypothetical protein RRG08_058072 [Elysia crispata]|uniref:Uncharacterized protein n=1 Tax=Elysia crispata TaxID=231223 RepID=A0AAE1ABE1_9GAST|nr:hypothetical protein RRG08_058072 [Elysia crispata]
MCNDTISEAAAAAEADDCSTHSSYRISPPVTMAAVLCVGFVGLMMAGVCYYKVQKRFRTEKGGGGGDKQRNQEGKDILRASLKYVGVTGRVYDPTWQDMDIS